MAEEWVDQALDQAHKAAGRLSTVEKAYAETDQKLKETLSQLTEVEKSWKNAKAALFSFEKQAAKSLEAQKKVENKLALTMVGLKQT